MYDVRKEDDMKKKLEKRKLIYLSVSNIFFYKFRSFLLLFFFVALFFTLEVNQILIRTFDASINNITNMLGADFIVAPLGSNQKVIDAISTGKPTTIHFDEDKADYIYRIKEIKEVNKRLMVASIEDDCCDTKVQFIGIDFDTDKQIISYLSEYKSNVDSNNIIIGHNIKYKIGDCPRFFDQIYKVTGKLKETGMGYDSSIFFDINQAEQLFEKKMYQKFDGKVSIIFLTLNDGSDVDVVKKKINKNLRANGLQAYSTSKMLLNISDGIKKAKIIIYFYSALIFFICCISIYSVTFFDIGERKAELDTYEMLGMSNKKKIELVVIEKNILVIISSLFGFVISGTFILLLRNYLSLQSHLMFNVSASAFLSSAIFFTLIILFFEGIIALYTVKRTFRTDE